MASPGRAMQAGLGCYAHHGKTYCTTGFAETPEIPAEPCPGHAWAACLAYLLRGFGVETETAAVLARAGGRSDAACRAPTNVLDRARISGSAGEWVDRAGRRFLLAVDDLGSIADTYPQDPAFYDLLYRLRRQPVLCGAAGHTTIVTQIRTVEGLGGWLRRDAVLVRDPCAPDRGPRALTEAELATPAYVLGVAIRPL